MQERHCISGMILPYSLAIGSPPMVGPRHINRLALLVPFRDASVYLESFWPYMVNLFLRVFILEG